MTIEVELEPSIDSAVDALLPSSIALLKQMIAINSVNPLYIGVERADVIGGETACTRAVGAWLTQYGFALNEVAPDPERVNVVAQRAGVGGGRSLLLNGHVDTVAPFRPEEWKAGSPWQPLEEDGRIIGLGASDMKSGIVACALAAAALAKAGIRLKGDLQIHAVVGEETGSHVLGTTAVLKAGFTADAAIVTEPTSDHFPLAIAPVSPGSLGMRLHVKGKGTHAGNRASTIRAGGRGDAAGVNAVEKLLFIVSALQRLEQQWGISKNHPLFPPGQFCMIPSVFHGDVGIPATGYMADRAYAGYIIWYPPGENPAAVREEVEQFVHHASQLDSWLRESPPEFEWRTNWPAADTSPKHPLVLQLARERARLLGAAPGGRDIVSFDAVSDASHLEAMGIPAVVFGPGELRWAHAMDESVDVATIRDCARVLARTIVAWCGVA